MNPSLVIPNRPVLRRWLLAVLLFGPGWVALKSGAETSAVPKNHMLFMGADLFVQRGKDLLPVSDVRGDSFIAEADGKSVVVPTRDGPFNIKMAQSLKVTAHIAKIADLTGERAYTPGADPNRKFLAAAGNVDAADAELGAASGSVVQAEFVASAAGRSAGGSTAEAEAAVSRAYSGVNSASRAMGSDFNNTGAFALRRQEELAQKLFDAIDISFQVSAEQPLSRPYVVIMAQYRERDLKSGPTHNWIYAKSLRPIAAEPMRVHVRQGGFPPGFELADFQVRLYNYGEEVATNVSPKRLALSRDEAFEFMRIDHIDRHKGATLPATPAMGTLPPDLRLRVAKGEIQPLYYLRVSKEGRAAEAFLDEGCSQKSDDPDVIALVQSLRFRPALDKGKPVETVTPLNLTHLSF